MKESDFFDTSYLSEKPDYNEQLNRMINGELFKYKSLLFQINKDGFDYGRIKAKFKLNNAFTFLTAISFLFICYHIGKFLYDELHIESDIIIFSIWIFLMYVYKFIIKKLILLYYRKQEIEFKEIINNYNNQKP